MKQVANINKELTNINDIMEKDRINRELQRQNFFGRGISEGIAVFNKNSKARSIGEIAPHHGHNH